jgi:hypothetical protein
MKPTFFANKNGKFTDVTATVFQKSNGLWQSVLSFDIDHDGLRLFGRKLGNEF